MYDIILTIKNMSEENIFVLSVIFISSSNSCPTNAKHQCWLSVHSSSIILSLLNKTTSHSFSFFSVAAVK